MPDVYRCIDGMSGMVKVATIEYKAPMDRVLIFGRDGRVLYTEDIPWDSYGKGLFDHIDRLINKHFK